jgi:hypothetical protein
LGTDGLKVAAALLAKNIGGGINYVAVCTSLAASPQSVAAGLCVDNLFALLYFPVTNALGSGRPDVIVDDDDDDNDEGNGRNKDDETTKTTTTTNPTTSSVNVTTTNITVQSASTALCLSTALLWVGGVLGRIMFPHQPTAAQLPICTLLTVVVATIVPRIQQPQPQRHEDMTATSSSQLFTPTFRETCNVLGTVCLYLFFSTAGAPGLQVADTVRSSLWPLTVYLSSLYGIHGGILWFLYAVLGRHRPRRPDNRRPSPVGTFLQSAFRPQRVLVASSSAIGGPATSVALAQSNGWTSLTVPALLVGNIGYAVATFCGLAFYYLLL